MILIVPKIEKSKFFTFFKLIISELEILINRLDIVEECIVYGMPDKDNDVKLSVKIVYNKDIANNRLENKNRKEW